MTSLHIFLTLMFAQNAVLSHYAGVFPLSASVKNPPRAALVSAFVTGASLWATAIYWPLRRLVLENLGLEYLGTLVLSTTLALSAVAAVKIGSTVFPFHRRLLRRMAPISIANAAVFVVVASLAHTAIGFGHAMLGALSAGLGVFFGLVPIAAVRRTVERRRIPRPLKGDVIVYLAVGLMALVLEQVQDVLRPFLAAIL